ncbi:hypothetical protein FOXG_22392 [Fusarium oxysporum f. sp. lycopersici 4287]|uniref:Uncharacterized protein n=1 Tax=Fusarium oxysporum f. sp. lycopersici (strain 4287 / CBS 123668 / FGSC 9935 / NRRL 34936) TaxID=426428 RepID=A0A0J9UZZ7_FUSO4|nr:hypothetical protein FOXG_19444 [Fusarium oxysporum f. sp. lycopersici 4287]XP_018256710.1 hypothetical protein FOXG_22329 [Fusarium oxysporum f. sp. lycopersici 4287]XP_018256881.1 hypothetical protein FOXG_22392 [Fusarium oxysporum f. sp. lycopersici 4287]KNB04884.1 hypothetical protein FOXG_19444 [Fusarium oxysporum f. sp. lycopersici 4287]KNB18665.1 hypothetical protein FOXG_22329 [Fusarium oxysporum f. sp. lycopersici 4287]KNB18836.1 hypothetical protein FOXG_22392 [Fusarium oxysporum 
MAGGSRISKLAFYSRIELDATVVAACLAPGMAVAGLILAL